MLLWISRALAAFGALLIAWFVAFQPMEYGLPVLLILAGGMVIGLRGYESLPNATVILLPVVALLVFITPMFLTILGDGTGLLVGLGIAAILIFLLGLGMARTIRPAKRRVIRLTPEDILGSPY